MTSVGLLERIEQAIENSKNGTLSGQELESVIKALSSEVSYQSARLLSLGSSVYPKQIGDALDTLIKSQGTNTETSTPNLFSEPLPIIPDAIPQGGDGLEKVEGDFTQAI